MRVEFLGGEVEVKGLPGPRVLEWTGVSLDTDTTLQVVLENAPVGADVVEWMQLAAAGASVLEVYSRCIRESGGVLKCSVGDPYIPGVSVDEEFYAVSEPWSTVRRRGYGRVVTPYGEFRVPVGGVRLIAVRDFLGWACLPRGWSIQWLLALVRWVRPPSLPVRRRIGLPVLYGRVVPFFARYTPRLPTPLSVIVFELGSGGDQKVLFRGRSLGDYGRVLWEERCRVRRGRSRVVLTVTGLPTVTPQLIEFTPQHTWTILYRVEVIP